MEIVVLVKSCFGCPNDQKFIATTQVRPPISSETHRAEWRAYWSPDFTNLDRA